jgi:hypothetical protein
LASFSFQVEEKKKKTIKKKTNVKKGGSFPSSFSLPSHFWLSLLPFCFKRFFLASFFSQAKKKKNHKEEKKCIERKELSFKFHFIFSLLALAFALPLLPFCLKRFLLTCSSSQVEKKKK